MSSFVSLLLVLCAISQSLQQNTTDKPTLPPTDAKPGNPDSNRTSFNLLTESSHYSPTQRATETTVQPSMSLSTVEKVDSLTKMLRSSVFSTISKSQSSNLVISSNITTEVNVPSSHNMITGSSIGPSRQFTPSITPSTSMSGPCTPDSDGVCETSESLEFLLIVIIALSAFIIATIIIIFIIISILLCLRRWKKRTGLVENGDYDHHDDEVVVDTENHHKDEVITLDPVGVSTDSHSEPSLDSAIDVTTTSPAFDMIFTLDNPSYNAIIASSGSSNHYSELSSSTDSAEHIVTTRNEAYNMSTSISTTDNPAYQPTHNKDTTSQSGSFKYDYIIHNEDLQLENSFVYDYPRFMQ